MDSNDVLRENYDQEPGTLDAKGRKAIHDMTLDEKLDEVLAIGRATQDLVEKFFTDFASGNIQLPGPLGLFAKMMK